MKNSILSPAGRNKNYYSQIGPTPQFKGQLKSILDTASPSPLIKGAEQLARKKLSFDEDDIESSEMPESVSASSVDPKKEIFLSPIKLLQNIEIKSSFKKKLTMDLIEENSSDESDNVNETSAVYRGVLSVYNKGRILPKEQRSSIKDEKIITAESYEESANDLVTETYLGAVSSDESEDNDDDGEDDNIVIEEEKLIGRPVQGYMKRKLMQMQPMLAETRSEDSKQNFNEIYNELKKRKLAVQEGTYESTEKLKGTLTEDVTPDIKVAQKKKFNTVSNNFVKINLKRKSFRKKRR